MEPTYRELQEQLEAARQEIEALRQAEVQARTKERIYQRCLESISDMILVKGEKSTIYWANSAFCNYYGMTNEDLQGMIDAEFNEPDYTLQYIQDDMYVWNSGKTLQVVEPVTRHDGEVHIFETVKSAIRDESGNVALTIGVSRDITERKEKDEELKRSKEAAERANRAKSDFLANMSHELRTPLNAILGYAQILKYDRGLTSRQQEGLDTIQRSGEHLLLLINDVLDLSKIEAGRLEISPTNFHFGRFLKTLSDLFEMRAQQQRISFGCSTSGDLPLAVSTDETRLRQILLNLLSNAVKFTSVGGVTLTVRDQAGRVRFEVQDTGTGIPNSELSAIFQPFVQVSTAGRVVEGTGLGLAITHRLVAMLGGELHVRSRVGEGSTFWFELDLKRLDSWSEDEPARNEIIEGYDGGRKKILVVDDKVENRLVLARMLEPLGFEVAQASNGLQGIETAKSEQPDLILMDLVMPVLDGYEATRRLRAVESFSNTPIIAASASVFASHQSESIQAGCDSFISKPIRMSELIQILENYLDINWVISEIVPAEYDEPAPTPTAIEPEDSTGPELPPETLLALRQAASIGDIMQITQLLEELPSGGVVGRLRELASRYQTRAIRNILDTLEGKQQ